MCNFHKTKQEIREEYLIQYSGADPELNFSNLISLER